MKLHLVTVVVLAALVAACQNPPRDDQRTGSVDPDDIRRARTQLAPEVRTHLDNGNEAYRQGEYEAAKRHYEEAVRLDANVAAGWFGIYMAEMALGNIEAANTAIDRARDAAPQASLIEEEPGP
jgi:tetratricopeptide (TPR) repeat protein